MIYGRNDFLRRNKFPQQLVQLQIEVVFIPAPQDLIDKLKSRIGNLSEAKAKVARYLVTDWDKAAFMTAAQIGEASGSSGTVVIRLAEELGYEGYPALQRVL